MRLRPSIVAIAFVCAALLAAREAFLTWTGGMSTSIAPTLEDLERVYQRPEPRFADHQRAEAVLADAGGLTVLCETNPKGDGAHTWLVRLSHDGGLIWERHFPQTQGIGRAMTVAPDGSLVIAGEVQVGSMAYRAHLLRVDAKGDVLSAGAYGPPGVTGFDAVAALADGSMVAGGAAQWKAWLIQADGTLGSSLELPIDGLEEVKGLVPLADGGFALVGLLERSTTTFGLARIAAWSADRRLRWQRQLPTAGRGELVGLTMLPGGDLAAIGHHTADERAPARLWVVRIDAAGVVKWERLIGDAAETRRGNAIASMPDGSVVVAGHAQRDGRRGLRLARLEPDGRLAWERSYGGEGFDEARSLALTPDGGLVLVGSTTSKGAGRTNVWILRLDRDGRLLWDRAFGIAAEPDGVAR